MEFFSSTVIEKISAAKGNAPVSLGKPEGLQRVRNAVTAPSRHWLQSIRGRLRPRLIFCAPLPEVGQHKLSSLYPVIRPSYEFSGEEFYAKMKKFRHPFLSLRRIKVQILSYILFLVAHINVLLNPDCKAWWIARLFKRNPFIWKKHNAFLW